MRTEKDLRCVYLPQIKIHRENHQPSLVWILFCSITDKEEQTNLGNNEMNLYKLCETENRKR